MGNQKQGKTVEGKFWSLFSSDCETCLLQDIRHNYENKEEEEEWNRLSGLFLVASCPVVKCRKFQTSPQSVALSIITMNTCRELLEVYALRERSRRGSRGSDRRLHHAQFVLPKGNQGYLPWNRKRVTSKRLETLRKFIMNHMHILVVMRQNVKCWQTAINFSSTSLSKLEIMTYPLNSRLRRRRRATKVPQQRKEPVLLSSGSPR